jgi:hypothetical protein
MSRALVRRQQSHAVQPQPDDVSLSDVVATTLGEKVALGAMIAGGAAAIVGTIFYVRAVRRRTSTLRSALGEVKSRTHAGGMTLTHHYDPDMPIQQRVGILQDLVWKGVQQPQMRELALAITGSGERAVTVGKRTFKVRGANCPARDGLCEAEAVYNWVKSTTRYTGDVAPVRLPDGKIEGVDLFQSGLRTVEFSGGDCDDHSVLTATLLALNGIPARFRITAPQKNSDWAHILSVAGLPKTNPDKWVPMDTTLPGNMFGREAGFAKKLEFPI